MSAVSTRPRTTCRSSWRLSRFAFTELESPPLSDRPEGGRASAACASDPDETKPPAPAVARTHISKLTPEIFDSHFRSKGVPLVIEGALDPAIDWRLESFVGSFDAGVSYQCRVHGGDSFATSPDMWRNKKSHARHVVWTSPEKFGDTIAAGIATR